MGILRGSLWDQWRGRTVPWKSLFVGDWWIGGIGLWCPVLLLLLLASQGCYYRQCVELIQVHCDQRPLVSVIIFCFVITSSAIHWSEHPNQKGIVCSFLSGEQCCGWKCREKQHELRRCESCIVHCGEEGVRRKQMSSLNPVLFTCFVYLLVLPAVARGLLLLDHQPIFRPQTSSHLGQVKGLLQ